MCTHVTNVLKYYLLFVLDGGITCINAGIPLAS